MFLIAKCAATVFHNDNDHAVKARRFFLFFILRNFRGVRRFRHDDRPVAQSTRFLNQSVSTNFRIGSVVRSRIFKKVYFRFLSERRIEDWEKNIRNEEGRVADYSLLAKRFLGRSFSRHASWYDYLFIVIPSDFPYLRIFNRIRRRHSSDIIPRRVISIRLGGTAA